MFWKGKFLFMPFECTPLFQYNFFVWKDLVSYAWSRYIPPPGKLRFFSSISDYFSTVQMLFLCLDIVTISISHLAKYFVYPLHKMFFKYLYAQSSIWGGMQVGEHIARMDGRCRYYLKNFERPLCLNMSSEGLRDNAPVFRSRHHGRNKREWIYGDCWRDIRS